VPFFAFAPSIRKMIYTTNAVEALRRSLRKIIKTRGSFPTRFPERLSIGRASALKGLHSPNTESASASAPIAPQSRRGMS
jgi:hypothetical protein